LIKDYIDGCYIDNPEIERTFVYYVCAKEFGWLPDQVDNLEVSKLNDLLTVLHYAKKKEADSLKN
jgi:hypothetical protein